MTNTTRHHPQKTWSLPNPYNVYCYNLPLPSASLRVTDPAITFTSTSDLCHQNAQVNAGCHCEKAGSHVVDQKLVCDPVHFQPSYEATITEYCSLACRCFLGGPPDDGFPRSPNWFKDTRCKQRLVDEDGKNQMQTPIYCRNDDECGDGCFCNGQGNQWYMSGPVPIPGPKKWAKGGTSYTALRLVLGAGPPNDLGICGEKFKPAGTDGKPYAADSGNSGDRPSERTGREWW
ncbi:MAG: hypothetical protein M1835_004009 [Candelina submexicana]|nr:MAG: hypothetical protein M1835_004009 [Candelina submexicana]